MDYLRKISFLLLLSLAFTMCSPPIVFDEAYPKDEAAMSSFPENYQGIYLCESDSTLVVIKETIIYAKSFFYFEASESDLEAKEQCTIADGEIYLEESQECLPYEFFAEDSIRVQYYDIDTLFEISPKAILKSYENSLVLSNQVQNEWIITLLSIDEFGNVDYRAITESTDIEKVRRITPIKQVGVDRNTDPIYSVKPDKVAFEEMFNDHSIFISCEYLMRVNMEENPFYMY